jgi:hypothetical protein
VSSSKELPKPITDYVLLLTLRALALADLPAGTADPIITRVRVLRSSRVAEALAIEFQHPGTTSVTVVRFFPLERRGESALLEEFDAADPTGASLFEINSPEAIRTALYQAKHHLEYSLAEVRVISLPFDFEPAQAALLAARTHPQQDSAAAAPANVTPASEEAPSSTSENDKEDVTQLSFGALAIDILSGGALRDNAAHSERVAYAVWADPTDEFATLILRFFDEGATIAMAAYAFEGSTTELFQSQIEQLAEFFEHPPEDQDKPQRISDILSSLILLDETATCERLGRVMGALARYGGHLNEPGLYGKPSEATVARLDLLEEVTESRVWQSIVEGPSVFETIASTYLGESQTQAWTRTREEQGEARIEILEHPDYAGCLMVVLFEAAAEVPDVALYVPDLTEEVYDAYTNAVHLLMVDRRFGSHKILPLSGKNAFKHVAQNKAPALLEHCLNQLHAEVGFDFGFSAESLREGYEEAIRHVFAKDCAPPVSEGEPSGRAQSKLH